MQEQLKDIKKIYKKLNYIHLANDMNADVEREKGNLLTVMNNFRNLSAGKAVTCLISILYEDNV